MILTEDIQVQMFRQSTFGTAPGAPNGILLPRGSNFSLEFDQKLIDNPQVFFDGLEREPALGNKTSGANGDVVPNLNFFPELQKDIHGVLVTAGTGPFDHTSAGIDRTVTPIRMFELGLIPLNLFYRWFDCVLSEAHLKLVVEGIFSVGTKWMGTGKVLFPPAGTSLDATPTEIVGDAVNYADMVLLDNGVDGGDMLELNIDIVKAIKEKRPSGAAGEATQLRCGKVTVKGTAKFFFESDARWARTRNGVIAPLKATVAAGDQQTELTLTEVKMQPSGPKMEGDDGVVQEYSWTSVRKTNATDTPLKAVTTCDTPTVT